ncbi:MAG: pyridoxal-phosphate dependent enzyme [Chitinophagaceae bacterium]
MLGHLSFDEIMTDDISYLFNNEMQVAVLRLDKLHPVISGNKWFKLRYYMEDAKAQGKNHIITFGGAWSNHIVATAAACKMNGLKATGIIRGEEPANYSPTLLKAKELGMEFIFISREEYKDKIVPEQFTSSQYYIINEGGAGEMGAKGATTILDYCEKNYTHYCCAVGTGTMMAGIINAVNTGQTVIGISVMKNNTGLEDDIRSLIHKDNTNWQLLHDYHFGGYAKHQPSLLAFMNQFYTQTKIPSDFVYTGKLFYAINDLIEKNFFPANSNLLIIHSGGLQGNDSLPKGTLIF